MNARDIQKILYELELKSRTLRAEIDRGVDTLGVITDVSEMEDLLRQIRRKI